MKHISEVLKSLVYIEWVDSSVKHSGGSWIDVSKAHATDLTCRSVGFIVEEDDDSITIAGHVAFDVDCVSGNMTIPKVAIKKRRKFSIKGVT